MSTWKYHFMNDLEWTFSVYKERKIQTCGPKVLLLTRPSLKLKPLHLVTRGHDGDNGARGTMGSILSSDMISDHWSYAVEVCIYKCKHIHCAYWFKIQNISTKPWNIKEALMRPEWDAWPSAWPFLDARPAWKNYTTCTCTTHHLDSLTLSF